MEITASLLIDVLLSFFIMALVIMQEKLRRDLNERMDVQRDLSLERNSTSLVDSFHLSPLRGLGIARSKEEAEAIAAMLEESFQKQIQGRANQLNQQEENKHGNN